MEHASRDEMVEAACEQLGRLFDAKDRDALISTIRHLLSAVLQNNEELRARVAELLRNLHGRRSERFNPDQLSFGFLAVVPEPQAASESEPAASVKGAAKKPARRRSGHRGCPPCQRICRARKSACSHRGAARGHRRSDEEMARGTE